MAMPALPEARRYSVAEAYALPDDGNRYEVVDGELLVTPAPRALHQVALEFLALSLWPYLREHRVGVLLHSPADIELDRRSLVQPDLFVAPFVNGKWPRDWKDMTNLMLAVEVLSPSTARADRTIKRRRYQRAGIPEYWIVDLDARLIERWRPDDDRPELLGEVLTWQPRADVAPLRIDLAAFFRDVHEA